MSERMLVTLHGGPANDEQVQMRLGTITVRIPVKYEDSIQFYDYKRKGMSRDAYFEQAVLRHCISWSEDRIEAYKMYRNCGIGVLRSTWCSLRGWYLGRDVGRLNMTQR